MAWDDLYRALALFLIIEGLMPFLAPARWREMVARIITLEDRVIRTAAVVSISVGLLWLQWLNW